MHRLQRALSSSLVIAAALPCAAQTQTFVFEVEPQSSNWTWQAEANGIPVTPVSTNQFQMFGTFTAELAFNANGFAADGAITGGVITVAPDLEGNVSFLAHVKVTNLVLSPDAPWLYFGSFEASTGSFSADKVYICNATATVTPLFGSPTVTEVVDEPTTPAFVTGTITTNPDGTLRFTSPQAMQLILDDPGSGMLFIVDLAGTLTGNELRLVDPYCFGDGSGTACPCGNTGAAGAGCANGAGPGATLAASGVPSVTDGGFTLSGSGLTEGPGLYFQANNPIAGGAGQVFGDGLRCAGGGVTRLQVRIADASGTTSTTVDLAAVGGVAPGQTKHYQLWYRDAFTSPCGGGFNLTNALEVQWLP